MAVPARGHGTGFPVLRQQMTVPAYGFGTGCPVLTQRLFVPGRDAAVRRGDGRQGGAGRLSYRPTPG
eukprot:3318958-Rhodomonas_salina.1